MVHCNNKAEFERALKNGEKRIIVYGQLAQKIREKSRKKKIAKKAGIITAFGGLLAAPFTGGLSTAATGMGIAALTISMSTAELAILCGLTIAVCGISKGYDIIFNNNGSVQLNKKD